MRVWCFAESHYKPEGSVETRNDTHAVHLNKAENGRSIHPKFPTSQLGPDLPHDRIFLEPASTLIKDAKTGLTG